MQSLHHPLRQKSPSPGRIMNRTPSVFNDSNNFPSPMRSSPSRQSQAGRDMQKSQGYKPHETPLRSSGSKLSRGGLLTTDGRNRSHLKDTYGVRQDTDLYYSTTNKTDTTGGDLHSGDLHSQAMTIVRKKKNSMTRVTSPRHMLYTQAGASNETDSFYNKPIQSSYSRSSAKTKSRGKRPFEKVSYQKTFPIRCVDTDKCNTRARNDIEHRKMLLDDISSSKRNNDNIFVDDPSESLGSLSMSAMTQSQ